MASVAVSRKAPWIEDEALQETEAVLPQLLRDERGWKSLVSESKDAGMRIERLYRVSGEYDLFLVRCTRLFLFGGFVTFPKEKVSCLERLVQGRISMGICEPDQRKPPLLHMAAFQLTAGSWFAYRPGIRLSLRLESPYSLQVLVCKNAPVVDANPATPETIAEILTQFRKYYPHA